MPERAEEHHTGAEVEAVMVVVQMEEGGQRHLQMEDLLQEHPAGLHQEEEVVPQEQGVAGHLPGAAMAGATAGAEVHPQEVGAVHQADGHVKKAILLQAGKN